MGTRRCADSIAQLCNHGLHVPFVPIGVSEPLGPRPGYLVRLYLHWCMKYYRYSPQQERMVVYVRQVGWQMTPFLLDRLSSSL